MTEDEFRSGRGVEHHFDYMAECDKTCSTEFHPERVEVMDLRHVLMGVKGFAEDLNLIKKLLFRGKTREDLNFPPAEKPTAADLIDALTAINAWSPADIDVLHGAIGIITEAGEVAEYLLKWAEGNPFDRVNVLEESGDVSWYVVRTLRGIGVTLEQSNRANIDKLRGRHGEAFDVFKDANRDLNAEQSKLEDHFKSAAGNTLFDAEIPVVKNPELDKLASQLPDDDGTSKASRMEDVNAEIHAKGVAHMRKAQGDMAEMAERIAQEVQPVPKGGVRG
ncbi:MAG: hypothetical protein CMQ11_07180 [Gammaproteobacteria bacterium]|nr:hypothetical protein [Gammaproteobacteria bacterium]